MDRSADARAAEVIAALEGKRYQIRYTDSGAAHVFDTATQKRVSISYDDIPYVEALVLRFNNRGHE